MKPRRREEARARKLFRKIRIGSHYEWVNAVGEKHVIRVKQKRLTLTPTDAKCEMKGVYFFLDKTGETRGEGHPAYAAYDSWERVTPKTKKFKGARPRRQPIHAKWFCVVCDRQMKHPLPVMGSPCCRDEIVIRFWATGKHDTLCVCSDCDPDDKRRSALKGS